jgi:TonB family protein
MKIYLMALCVWMSVAAQSESFEKQALYTVRRIPASTLDSKLPSHPFADWFNDLVGKEMGVVWQLAECGKTATSSDKGGQDVRACAEAIVILPSGGRLILDISVGTFNRGMTGAPAFLGAVIEKGEQLYQVRRLSDLPWAMRYPGSLPRDLPDLQREQMSADLIPSEVHPPSVTLHPDVDATAPRVLGEDNSPPPPPPRRRSQQSSGAFVEATPITKAKPVYPDSAKSMNVFGKVEVRVVISEKGRVIEAAAISGHMTLRSAAEDAARRWVYKPATRDGVPVKTEAVLTFTFAPDAQ